MFIWANARRKKLTECITEYSCGVLGLVAFESCRRRDAYLLWNITEYWCEDVQIYKLQITTTLAAYRPCRRRVEQYGTTVVNICKKYIQTVRHACRKTSRHHRNTAVGANIRMLCKPAAVTTFVLREGICDLT